MDEQFIESVYETVLGQIVTDFAVPEVENLFAPGKECDRLYLRSREAYNRLCTRLGVYPPEDHDLDTVTDCLDRICRLVAFEMFRCGASFQQTASKDH